MPIRTRNLDLQASDHLKGHCIVDCGDVTAARVNGIFIAPVPCVVDFVDVYNRSPQVGASSVSSVHLTLTVQQLNSGSVLTSRGNSATAVTTNSISAGARYRLTPSANNSLSIGAGIELVFGISGSAVLSAVSVHVTYTPLLHRESR